VRIELKQQLRGGELRTSSDRSRRWKNPANSAARQAKRMKKPAILVVDDDAALRELITCGWSQPFPALTRWAAVKRRWRNWRGHGRNAVLTDMQMRAMDGMALFRAIHARDPALPVIVLTAHGTIPDAVAATQQGLFRHLTTLRPATWSVWLKRATLLAGGKSRHGRPTAGQRNPHRQSGDGHAAGRARLAAQRKPRC